MFEAIKAELEARLLYERDVRQYLENKWRNYNEEINALKEGQMVSCRTKTEKERNEFADEFSQSERKTRKK